jgi:NAD(P)-dependent dehydrogenase (short-subunit alcohol dehydrogenase family)
MKKEVTQMKPKTILITGASSGFGKLTVPLLLSQGHQVIAAVRGGSSRIAEIFPSELRTHPGQLHGIDLHLERPETFGPIQKFLIDRFNGRLDVLINNAGYGLFGTLEDFSIEQFRHQFEVNFFGPMFLTRSLLPLIREAKGRILNVSSIVGLVSFPIYGTYSATKHAMEAQSEALAYELRPFGVQVGLIEPGGFRTDFNNRSIRFSQGTNSTTSPYHARMQNFQKALAAKSEFTGDPIRVARVIARLCEKKRVPIRTLVGPDARALAMSRRLLPECIRFRLTEWGFRKFFA